MSESYYYKNLQNALGDLNKWRYAGGNRNGRHNNYFEMMFKNKPIARPPIKNKCLCGHRIEEQCYIYNKEENKLDVLGNCCIKKFIEKSSRTCEECDQPHKNRKSNKCNDCRYRFCKKCNIEKFNGKYEMCNKCFFKN
jgi:hypothetical protein